MCGAAVANGERSRRICRRAARCTVILPCGLGTARSIASSTRSMYNVGSWPTENPARAPPSSTVKASRARKKMLWGKRRDSCKIVASINLQLTELRMQKPHDNSKASPAAFMQDNTLIAVIELSLSNWLVAGLIPGVSREPLTKFEPNPEDLLKLLHGWRDEAIKAGRPVTRIAETNGTRRGNFSLAPWLQGHGIDAHGIPATSVTESREHRRAKTERRTTAI